MRVEATFTVDAAQTDTARRRVVGLVVPFGEQSRPANLGGVPTKMVVEAGGLVWDSPDQVKLVVDHNGDKPVFAGKARDLVETRAGIVGTFAIAATTAGNDYLVEAAEQLRTGLSIEAEIPDPLDERDGVVYLTSSNPGRLVSVAAVPTPAFASAQVTSVAASTKKGTTMTEATTTTAEAAEVPNEDLGKAVTALTDVATLLAQALGASPAVDPNADPNAAAAPAAASLFGTASTQVTKEAFPYGHPGAEGTSFFRDLHAARDDADARQRVVKAQAMLEKQAQVRELTAADEAVAKSDIFIPNTYQSDLYVSQVNIPRVIADAMPLTAISSSRPIVVPKFTSAVADGGSGEVVAAHSENTNPSSGELALTSVSSTPTAYSGKIDVSREAVDAGDPTTDMVIMNALRESYAQTTEAAAVTALLATSGAATGSSTTDASAEVEARNMFKLLRKEIAKFGSTRGLQPDVVWYDPTDFQEAVAADGSTSGLPLYPTYNPTNTQSAIPNIGNLGPVLNVLGVPGLLAPKLTTAKVVIARTGDLHRWESPLLNFRWEEVAGPAKIRFVAFGYAKFVGLQGKGVTILTQA